MTTYKVALRTTTELLGTAPNNPQIYADFIVTKKMAEGKFTTEQIENAKKDELETLPGTIEGEDKGVTVFRRRGNELILMDFMIRGFLKSASASITGGWGLAGKIDHFIHVGRFDNKGKFVQDRDIVLVRDGQVLTAPDAMYDRPLRAQTAQGERISLASSELVYPTVNLDFHLTVLPMVESGKGMGTKDKPMLVDQDLLESWFSYGQLLGLGQFRNGSFGRFDATVTKL